MLVDLIGADLIGATLHVPVMAEAAITWTPKTFYIAAAITHTIVYLLGYKLLQTDPEHNTFIGAVIGAAIANFAAFALRDFGLFGILGAGAIHFAILCAISSGEILKSVGVFLLAMGAYAGLSFFLIPRTPLTIDTIGGVPRVIVSGGLEAEPITEEEANEMAEPSSKKKDR